MNRRVFLSAVTGSLLVVPFVAEGQPADKVYRIGFLGFGSRGPFHQVFEQALGERG